jgi:drug/metabolite transporter (DMT)-like permease
LSIATFAIVLFAAFLHAFWNAVVKGAEDKTIVLGLIALGHVVPGFAMVALFASPGVAVVPYLIASTVIHWVYYYLLNFAYRTGDLSVVYPIARGLAPVFIALGAQVFVGEILPLKAWIGILCVSVGIMFLASGVFRSNVPIAGMFAAGGTAIMIASYSIVDGVGVRLSGSVLGYMGWLFVAEIIVAAYIFVPRWDRLRAVDSRTISLGILGGVVSGAAYGLVLYAKTLAALGMVSAVRETSVIFATLIGVLWFREGPKRGRLAAAGIVAFGIVLIAFTRTS